MKGVLPMKEIKYSHPYKEYKINQLIQQSKLIPILSSIISSCCGVAACIPTSHFPFENAEEALGVYIIIFISFFSLTMTFIFVIFSLFLPPKYRIICQDFITYRKARHLLWEEEQKKWLW